MSIIGISGKINSGKDLTAKIIQYLIYCNINGRMSFETYDILHSPKNDWKIVRFADKVKDIVCLMIGCTRKDLENEEFKNTELGEEWIRYDYAIGSSTINGERTMNSITT